MKDKLKNTVVIIIELLAIAMIILGLVFQQVKIDSYKAKFESSELTYNILLNSYELNRTEHQLIIDDYKDKLSTTEEALNTALKNNDLIETLSNTPMGEWTVTDILTTREMFDSIPYGSPFEGGHFVTGAFGSRELSGTHWKNSGHIGIDIFPNSGVRNEVVRSVIDGRVVTWGRDDRIYGNYLVIESLDGMYQIKFAHLSSIAIFFPDGAMDLYEGMEFKRGTRIARMGNTGKTSHPTHGHHLHMEYYIHSPDGMRLLNADTISEYTGLVK